MIRERYTCLLFGEGKTDKDFIYALSNLPQFKFKTEKKWTFTYGNAHGCSVADVIKLCEKEKCGDIALCFVDLDKLKSDYKKDWEKKKVSFEKDALSCGISIIWQIDKAEDEYKKVLGKACGSSGKYRANKMARENVSKFINSEFWKRMLKPITDFEKKH